MAFYFSVDEFIGRKTVNRALENLVRGAGHVVEPWYGPVLVLKAVNDEVTDFCDIGGDDVNDVCSYFAQFGVSR